ncbi:MAG TPA: YdcF family protein [Candidatus Paceibacterota bacterium]|nr:YdcF family protein [Candidatus Paceibacterota bacterium]
MVQNNLFARPLVVLGKGIKKRGFFTELTPESRISATAAGLLFENEEFSSIIFTGGKTLGNQYASEAECMEDYLLENFTSILPSRVFVEPESIDTLGNINEMLHQGFIRFHKPVDVLSTAQHIWRAKRMFRSIAGIDAKMIASQKVIQKYGSPEDNMILDEYEESSGFVYAAIKEFILNGIVLVDPKGKLLRHVTRLTRHGKDSE